MTPQLISIYALCAMFVVATIWPVNMGVLAFVGAFLVGTLVAGMSTKDIITGFPGGLIALALAMVGGGLTAIAFVSSGPEKRRESIPFGPFLCAGTFAALIWGKSIADWYLGLIL